MNQSIEEERKIIEQIIRYEEKGTDLLAKYLIEKQIPLDKISLRVEIQRILTKFVSEKIKRKTVSKVIKLTQ
jgi:hypothetical protein